MEFAKKPRWGALLGALAACASWACGDDPSRPQAEMLDPGDADGGTPAKDAGPPLDCKTSRPDQDADYDTFTRAGGDCNDCDPLISPASFEVAGNDVDEDCDGTAQATPTSCDADLDAYSQHADDAARALGLCNFAAQIDRKWGARYVAWSRLDGSATLEDPRQVWLTDRFGAVTPHEGQRMLVLSTGVARDEDERDYTPGCDVFSSQDQGQAGFSGGVAPPKNYPVDSSLCPAGSSQSSHSLAFNDVGLSLKIRIPNNAHGVSFDSIFFTYEYPSWVCSAFNDFFAVFKDGGDKSVVFDAHGDPVGVNTALLSVCRPSELAARKIACEQGPELLAGTGFDEGEATCGVTPENADVGGASTGWLRTTVPVDPRKDYVTLLFRLWDSGDPKLDSTVLIDNLHFDVEAPAASSTIPINAAP